MQSIPALLLVLIDMHVCHADFMWIGASCSFSEQSWSCAWWRQAATWEEMAARPRATRFRRSASFSHNASWEALHSIWTAADIIKQSGRAPFGAAIALCILICAIQACVCALVSAPKLTLPVLPYASSLDEVELPFLVGTRWRSTA